MVTINGKEFRNLVEQVQKNKDDIANYHNFNEALADWGIRIIGRLDVWAPPPEGDFEYGDAYAVGPEGGPFVFYIWTRGTPDYWFDYGAISIVGPQGPQGEPGDRGPAGESSKWFVGKNEPSGASENDMWLKVNNDNTTNGFVYQYNNGAWALYTTILGPQGLPGPAGKEGPRGPQGPQGEQGPAGNPSPVINIIAELPEGSVISDTYDPANVPSNSGVLMPVGGVNHLWIIINGVWTDSGSWGQGGTQVLVNGVKKTNVDLDYYARYPGNTSSVDRVLGLQKNTIKTGTYFGVSDATVVGSMLNDHIVRYGTNTDGGGQPSGFLVCHNPVNNFHAATKTYVDNQIATKIAAAHGEKPHASMVWTNHEDSITIELGLGFYLDYLRSITYEGFGSNGDFVEWGGSITFETSGGYVYINDAWHYNDAISGKLTCRFDSEEATLSCMYPGGGGTGLPQEMATFSMTNAYVNTAGNLELTMTPNIGLPGGAFTVHSLPG